MDFDDEAERQRAVDLAGGADVAVVVLGEWQNMIGEAASRSSLELPGRQLELLQAVVATGTPVVLLVLNGRPLDLRWAAEQRARDPEPLVPRHPGRHRRREPAVRRRLTSRSAALHLAAHGRTGANVLRPHALARPPQAGDRRYWDEESTPLFRFGHGLSYSPSRTPTSASTGTRSAPRRPSRSRSRSPTPETARRDEVVQLYIHQRYGTASRPVRELKGFRRISLAAGESRTLEFTLGPASGATGMPSPATGCSTPRPSTSGSAATRRRSSGPPSR